MQTSGSSTVELHLVPGPASWQNYRDAVKTTEAQARAREEQRKGRPGAPRHPCLDPHGPHGQRQEMKHFSVLAGRLGSVQNTRGGSLEAAAVPCHSHAALLSPFVLSGVGRAAHRELVPCLALLFAVAVGDTPSDQQRLIL